MLRTRMRSPGPCGEGRRQEAGGPERPGRVGRDLSDGKRSCDSAAVSALCCNVHRRHLATSKYEFVARCAFSCLPLGHIQVQVACPPVPFRFSVLVTFRAYLDYFGFRSGHSAVTRTGTTGIACPPVPLFGARYIFSCLPRIFLFSVTRNHWHSMSAVPLFGARYTFW